MKVAEGGIAEIMSFLKDSFPDEIRHPIIADSKDWAKIAPALDGLVDSLITIAQFSPANIYLMGRPFTVALEQVYVMGYMRGKREAQSPITFLVGEEEK